jgi:hypothetical protein
LKLCSPVVIERQGRPRPALIPGTATSPPREPWRGSGRRLDGADGTRTAAKTATIADSYWATRTVDHILTVMEASRSTWQIWHVGAEAQRQVRTTGVTAERRSALVDLLVDEVLDRRPVALAAPHDGIEEPEVLRVEIVVHSCRTDRDDDRGLSRLARRTRGLRGGTVGARRRTSVDRRLRRIVAGQRCDRAAAGSCRWWSVEGANS